MRCSSCGSENREGRKFCAECGAALALACAACGASNQPGERFCGECGKPLAAAAKEATARDPRSYTPKHLVEKILTSRSALEGERKQVTVLFADVKGSTELASELDPEEWHGIMDRFFQILAEGVHRLEGTVNEYRGDGIMALFGAPIAHEDHAQRACYAALHLRDALRRYADELRIGKGISFSVRMGLNSGEVVVGKIGDDLWDGLYGARSYGQHDFCTGSRDASATQDTLYRVSTRIPSGLFRRPKWQGSGTKF
jgi:Adenylate and Guanylate cyclase catalytic domain/Double zinc ribbon